MAAESEQEHHCHDEEGFDWENSKLYQCKLAYKKEYIARVDLGKDHRLMDVGCAEGEFMEQLSGQVHSIVGVDIDAAEIEKARKANTSPNVTYEIADFGANLGDHGKEWREMFDTVLSGFTLHFTDDVEAFIKNLHHCIKPGGKLHLTYMGDRRGWTAKAGAFVKSHPKWGEFVKDAKSKNNIVESTADEVKKLFTANGFSGVQVEEHDLATDDYSDEDAQGYIYGVLALSFSIPEEQSSEYMADVCKFTREAFGTNTPWEYVQLIASK